MVEQSDPVGSLADELAKLMGVVSGLAEQSGGAETASAQTDDGNEPGNTDATPDDAAHDTHIADGSASCQLCPVCQTIAFVRTASPEVREQLAASAASLAAAARSVVEGFAAKHTGHDTSARDSRVENIDLSEDGQWD